MVDQSSPPAQSSVAVHIQRLGHLGDGVAEGPGGPVHVPGALAGERVRVRFEPGGKNKGVPPRATLLEVLDPAPERVAPVCRHAGQCGGCSLQHMSLPALGAWKQGLVRNALVRAGFTDAPEPALFQAAPSSRRRATFAARRRGKGVIVGYCERRSHRLIALEECPVLLPELAALPKRLGPLLAPILPAEETVDISATFLEGGLDLVLTGPAHLDLARREALSALAEALDVARLSWRPSAQNPSGKSQPGKSPAVGQIEPVAVRRSARVMCGPVGVVPPPGGFLQAVAQAEAAMVAVVREAIPKGARVADLFCGCGAFALPLAVAGHRVLAVDSAPDLIAALIAAARGHFGGGADAVLATELRDLVARPLTGAALTPGSGGAGTGTGTGVGAVVFDPPRAGAAAQAAALAAAWVPVVVALSCNPATFERDARCFAGAGYRLVRALAVDQFLWSAHTELVAVFSRT